MVKIIVAMVALIVMVTASIFVADRFLGQYGLDFGSLLGILFASASQDDEGLAGFDDVNRTLIGNDTYDSLSNDKRQMEDAFEYARPMIGAFNNDTGLADTLAEALGHTYVVYIYSIVREPIEFKVFEWTIEFEDGRIVEFEPGKTVSDPNVEFMADHSIVGELLAQNYNQSSIISWVQQGKIIVSPVSEIGRVLQVLPAVLERLGV